MADSQKMGSRVHSGGQRIDNHTFWAGAPGKNSRFPDGPHKTKTESSAEGAGSLGMYEDTTEKIKEQQNMGIRKAEGHKQKPQYRN